MQLIKVVIQLGLLDQRRINSLLCVLQVGLNRVELQAKVLDPRRVLRREGEHDLMTVSEQLNAESHEGLNIPRRSKIRKDNAHIQDYA